MNYTYTWVPHRPTHMTIRLLDLEHAEERSKGCWGEGSLQVTIHDGKGPVIFIQNDDDLEAFRMDQERKTSMLDKTQGEESKIAAAVNPSHYKSFFGGFPSGHVNYLPALQWLEAKQYEREFADPDKFLTALALQYKKYLDRLGGKDNEVQELLKAAWYIRFAAAYIANGKRPIRIIDIPKLLGEKD